MTLTKRELQRITHTENTLCNLGFTIDEARALRRISMTLRRWHELECGIDNGCIGRDETTGKAYWLNSNTMRRFPIADRETGARKRLASIIRQANERRYVGDAASIHDSRCDDLSAYVQGDPRGAALYILRPGDIPEGQTPDSCYSRGICVY